MFVSNKLVYTELHKTGGTHIGTWLSRLIDGKQVGKHNRIPAELWNHFVVGSIRNPWDWYVSLWAYGCGGKGSVCQQVTKRIDFEYLLHQLHTEMGQIRTSPVCVIRQISHNFLKPVRRWKEVYRDYNDADAFRSWLRSILDYNCRFDFGEGYGFSPIAKHSGLLTYRFFKLYSSLGDKLYNNSALATPEQLGRIWEQNQLVDFVIMMENLENDLLAAMTRAGVVLTDEENKALLAAHVNKTNTSKRLPVSYYYDEETIELVANKENFIIESYGYRPPVIQREAEVTL